MKKALLIIIAAIMAVCAFGENQYDIIYTTDGKSIEAVIAEVSKTEVKYHEPGFMDGPLFVVSTDDIVSINFSNGQIKTYKFGSAYHVPETSKTVSTTTSYTSKPSQNTGYINVVSGHYYLNNSPISAEACKYELMKCPAAYKMYSTGRGMEIAGAVISGLGLGESLGSAIGMIIKASNGLDLTSNLILCAGGLIDVLVIGVPLLVCGGNKRDNAINIYNNNCSMYSDVQLQFQASQNGIGLALKF